MTDGGAWPYLITYVHAENAPGWWQWIWRCDHSGCAGADHPYVARDDESARDFAAEHAEHLHSGEPSSLHRQEDAPLPPRLTEAFAPS
jgi:hypothetical protein